MVIVTHRLNTCSGNFAWGEQARNYSKPHAMGMRGPRKMNRMASKADDFELTDDMVAFFQGIDRGFIGYPAELLETMSQ